MAHRIYVQNANRKELQMRTNQNTHRENAILSEIQTETTEENEPFIMHIKNRHKEKLKKYAIQG